MRSRYHTIVLVTILLFLLQSCSSEHKPHASFYYWKSTFRLSKTDSSYLSQLRVKQLNVKFFDVDWNFEAGKALPVAEIRFTEQVPNELSIIPTIFITNRTMVQIPVSQVSDLATKITTKIRSIADSNHLSIKEIQLDCDWSEKSREKFFLLASLVKKNISRQSIQLSATIRLHQLKYIGRAGIPPVDKGILMFYNMGSLDGRGTDNSILDLTIARQYLRRLKDYPLPLDIALPIYQWVVLQREGQVINLLTNVSVEALHDTLHFEPITQKKFRVRESHYFHSLYLYRGDELRLEEISLSQLQESADLLNPIVNQSEPHILFYYLDEKNLTRYAPEDLQKVVNHFR
ncbi:hypothetical protein QNI19_36630 [Cytophagaceae bacterium DM2B3-1]|uniref:Lipoprotein n=1 Tax=Xanthocytophaga flava TaxID=3048013 RepID=A0ABT7CXR7_9BACT|nr:hypothetical protein [Xanthocytophaga flavus]MDJ1466436.1 hypothetical protein [Xanthocytophaga flavus]MDJ1498520.1 hypothetical protein [Xanthocytophaga flavus]